MVKQQQRKITSDLRKIGTITKQEADIFLNLVMDGYKGPNLKYWLTKRRLLESELGVDPKISRQVVAAIRNVIENAPQYLICTSEGTCFYVTAFSIQEALQRFHRAEEPGLIEEGFDAEYFKLAEVAAVILSHQCGYDAAKEGLSILLAEGVSA